MDKVKITFLKIWNSIKERWDKVNKTARLVTLSVFGAVVIAIVVLSIIFNQTGYAVLYSDISSTELTEVSTILRDELGVSDVQITGTQVKVPENMIDTIRMEMATRGFPKSNWNYDIWDSGVGMFSTDTEKSEKMRQQLCSNLSAALDTLRPVSFSRVLITPDETKQYVLAADETPVRVSVILVLKDGEKLKSKEIEGIYKLVEMSVSGLSRDYISIVDQNGIVLISEDAPTGAETLSLEEQTYKMQLQIQRDYKLMLEDDIKQLMNGAYRDFNITASVELDFGDEVIESTEFKGANVAEDGTQTGIVSDRTDKYAAGGIAAEGAQIGTTTNADISPDFPTLEAQAGSDMFYESLNEINYNVNEYKRQYQSGPVTIKKVSLSMLIDSTPMTAQEYDEFRNLLAQAAGTSVDLVSVIARPFTLKPNINGGDLNITPDANRNMLIFVIIALGVLLIILFFLAIMTSGSKKKRQIKARLAPVNAAGYANGTGNGGYDDMFGAVSSSRVSAIDSPREEDYGIASLVGVEGETRESVLKNEIREFARTNPDIVAQLIRTWMKE